ncbi:MAG: hypothetical protein KGL67_03120 [Patescibacteria group bacterium]|nr:hypothetical protein [Patescibacteria group bacterium]
MQDIKLDQKKIRSFRFRTFIKWLKRVLLVVVILLIGLGIFVKFDAPAAADITDNYIRPLIGDQQVIFIENIFFSISDIADNIIYKFKAPESPQFLDQGKNLITSPELDHTPIIPNESFKPLSGEGIWHNLSSALFPDKEVMATTFIRPDPQRSYAIVSIVEINTKLLGINAIAGTKEPGGSLGNPGPGVVPQSVADNNTLVGAFNGGFLYADGKYGMVVGDKTYAPLQVDAGTIATYSDGSIKIFNYTGDNLGTNVVFARQNGPLILENNDRTTMTPEEYKKVLGRVLHSKKELVRGTYTWRSGIGINKMGNLLYAAGNNLSPMTLADALRMAGALSAVQLDINPSQVHFYVFNKNSKGTYDSIPLNKELQSLNHPARYFNGSSRDFFYLYKK